MSRISTALIWAVALSVLASAPGSVYGADEMGRRIARPESFESYDPALTELLQKQIAGIEAEPDNGDLHGELGLIYEANFLWPLAYESYRRAAELLEDDSRWRFHLAVATWEVGEPSTAVELFKSVPSDDVDFTAALQRRGLAQLELGDYAAAQESFEKLIEIESDRPEGWTGLGETQLRQRDYPAAVEALERAVQIDPLYRAARYQLGQAYRGVGRLEDAERELQAGVNAATRYVPDTLTEKMEQYGVFLSLRLEQAGAALRNGDRETAVRILEESAAEYSENVTVLNNLAVAYLQAGRLESARELLEQARTISDQRFSTYINLSSWAMRSDKPLEALAFADEAVRRGPKSSQTHATRARILNQLGRLPEAAESLETAVALDRDDPQMLMALAGLRRYLGDLEASLVLYREISERWPQNFQGQLQRARLAAALRYSDEAATALERAREIEPANPAVIELSQYLEGDTRDN